AQHVARAHNRTPCSGFDLVSRIAYNAPCDINVTADCSEPVRVIRDVQLTGDRAGQSVQGRLRRGHSWRQVAFVEGLLDTVGHLEFLDGLMLGNPKPKGAHM